MNEYKGISGKTLWTGVIFFILSVFTGLAQKSPVEIKYGSWNIHGLRYYPFTQKADSIIEQVISKNAAGQSRRYKKTSVNLSINKLFLDEQIRSSTALYNYIIKPYESWLNYAQPVNADSTGLNLTIFLDKQSPSESSGKGLFDFLGNENIRYLLDEWIGEPDIFNHNEILCLPVKAPLSKEAFQTYRYFLTGITDVDGIAACEIVFFSKRLKENAFEGYLYISQKDLSLLKAIFTPNRFLNKGIVKSILFTQTPSKSESLLYLGDETQASITINQVSIPENNSRDSIPPPTESEKNIAGLIEQANRTPSYRNLKKTSLFLLTNRIGIFRDNWELGPVTQMVAYNGIEGLRLRIGGNTSEKLNKHLSAGGYLAYGVKDKKTKYRGNILYAHHPGSALNFSWVNDLNIPGYDLLDDNRGHFFYALSHSEIRNRSFQKIRYLSYENQFPRNWGIKIGAKYWSDRPVGVAGYRIMAQDVQTIVGDITNTELGLSFRFAPGEKFIRLRDKSLVFRQPDVDIRLDCRLGVKGVWGSDYKYRITGFSVRKKWDSPVSGHSLSIRISGGKVWDRVPFPLLFAPAGNQSYIFNTENYNLMDTYEFVTDRFIAGHAGFIFNGSPVKLFYSGDKTKTHLGIKTLYGPLSRNNDPSLHPNLFVFNEGTAALSNRPYTEINLGIGNIFNCLRIDYVRRLSYKNRGSLFISTSFWVN